MGTAPPGEEAALFARTRMARPFLATRFDPDRAPRLEEDALGAEAGEEERAPLERRRDVRDVRSPLRAGSTAEVAEAGAVAAGGVPLNREVMPAERVAAARHHVGDRADVAAFGGGDVEDVLGRAAEVAAHRVRGEVGRAEARSHQRSRTHGGVRKELPVLIAVDPPTRPTSMKTGIATTFPRLIAAR